MATDGTRLHYRLEDLDPRCVDDERVIAAAEQIASRVARPSEVELVISGHFRESLRGASPEPQEEQDDGPIDGISGATVWGHGRCTVVMPAWGFLSPPTVPETHAAHVIAHEAFHVLIGQRGERLCEFTRPGTGDVAARWLASIARRIVEEFRVERAIYEERAALRPPHRDAISEDLSAVDDAAISSTDPTTARQGDEAERYEQLLYLFRGLMCRVAYVAAADVATAGELAPSETDDSASLRVWERRVGDRYDRLVATLAAVPSALVECSSEALESRALSVIPLVRSWLEAFWLALGESEGGKLGVRSVRPLSWSARDR